MQVNSVSVKGLSSTVSFKDLDGDRSALKRALRKLQPTAIIGLLILLIFILISIFAPWIVPHDPFAADLTKTFQPPNSEAILGTDSVGRDQFSRLLLGARLSLIIGVGTVLVALTVALTLGVTAAYVEGRTDLIIMRFVDLGLSFPSILLALLLVTLFGQGMESLMIALAGASIFPYTRLVRSAVLEVKNEEYIQAARAIGCTDLRIILRHLLPNSMSTIIVFTSFEFPRVILTGAAFSFLGLGVQKPLPEWGAMLAEAKAYMAIAPHLSIAPGVALMLVVLGFNLVGDALRDILDPRTRK